MLDIESNRNASKYSRAALIGRVLWALCQPLFRFSPRLLYAWRAWLLRLFGAKIGKRVHIYPSVKIAIPWNLEIGDYSAVGDSARLYNLGPLKIGQRVTVSQYSHLCGGSHDYDSPTMDLIKAPIVIDDDAWVCADAFVGPGVSIGKRAIVGARAVVTKDVGPDDIVVGNPAKLVRNRNSDKS
jgi:putative colanic acid biosynthesis acetyltransferase WcaF